MGHELELEIDPFEEGATLRDDQRAPKPLVDHPKPLPTAEDLTAARELAGFIHELETTRGAGQGPGTELEDGK